MVLVDSKTGKALAVPSMKDGKEVGTATVDETTGKATFTPNKDPAEQRNQSFAIEKRQKKQLLGRKYTPTVTPVTPTEKM